MWFYSDLSKQVCQLSFDRVTHQASRVTIILQYQDNNLFVQLITAKGHKLKVHLKHFSNWPKGGAQANTKIFSTPALQSGTVDCVKLSRKCCAHTYSVLLWPCELHNKMHSVFISSKTLLLCFVLYRPTEEDNAQFRALEVLMLDDNKLSSTVFSSLTNLKRSRCGLMFST